MKPRLYIVSGIWYCLAKSQLWTSAGIGYTPSSAYQDWLALNAVRV